MTSIKWLLLLGTAAAAGTQVNLGGTLHAGSGFYVDILQAPGAGGFAPRPGGVIGLAAIPGDPRPDGIRIPQATRGSCGAARLTPAPPPAPAPGVPPFPTPQSP